MTERSVPSRHHWQESALRVLWGDEPEAQDPWPGLLDVVAKFGELTSEILDHAIQDAAAVAPLGDDSLSQCLSATASPPVDVRSVQAPMRVVLMGRTMAGKSSLLSAMTGSQFDRIGDGRQRFSRDVFGAAASVSEHIEVVDTPGVGAHGGADDTEVALKAALEADVILWVNSSDSIQEESAVALKLLGVIGKPIIVAINCRQSLEGVGRLNLLRFPDRVFGNRDGLVDEIRRHMASAGVEPIEVVHIHALAAAQAVAAAETDEALHAASRIEELTDALLRERAAHSETRRALRLVDGQRHSAEQLALALVHGAARLGAKATHDRAMTKDVHTRLNRLVRTAGEAMAADVEAAVGQRRDWHLTVTDFGPTVQPDWNDEVASMQEEMAKSLQMRLASLTTDVASVIDDADAEWTTVSPHHFALRDLAGFGEVWGNRIAKAGVGVAGSALGFGGGAWLGAQIGGALGLATGPGAAVTAGVGLVVGGIAGMAAGPIKALADQIFLGRDGVLRKRREEVAKQVGPILDELTKEYENAITTQLDAMRDGLARERARSEDHSACLERLSDQWSKRSEHLHDLVGELDRATASALLRINRRERLARAVTRATRVPGVCVLAQFEDHGFMESWLFPPDIGETLAGGRAPYPGGESASALSYALSLVDASVGLARANEASALLIIDADVPPAITETWSHALTAHTGKLIQIETTRRSRSS